MLLLGVAGRAGSVDLFRQKWRRRKVREGGRLSIGCLKYAFMNEREVREEGR